MKKIDSTLSKTKCVLFAFLIAFSFACNPDDGEDGAPGPQGEPGEDGNTNVTSSDWTSFDTSGWSSLQTEFGFVFRTFSADAPEIDQDIIETGTVLVYFKNALDQDVYDLPYTGFIGSNPGGGRATIDYFFSLNQLIFKLNYENNVSDPGFVSESWEYRYIVIPSSGIIESSSSGLYEMSYEEVLGHYNL